MKIVLTGIVQCGDACRVADEGLRGAIFIDDIDVLSKISETKFNGNVTIGIADERFTGDLEYDFGRGYSEWTPMDSDELKVGDNDMIEILNRYEGQKITMFISDEPINLLEK